MDNNIQLITYAYNKLIDNSKITISPINKFNRLNHLNII